LVVGPTTIIGGEPPRLVEYHRPQSRGGNTRALHRHTLIVEGMAHSFTAVGARKWAFSGDRVTFHYTVDLNGHRKIRKQSFGTTHKRGKIVVRGNRSAKQRLRSSPTRLPASRPEQHD